MKIDAAVLDALEVLERDRGVPMEAILDALANALVSAYKRIPGSAEEARVTIDADSGDIIVYAQELDEAGNVVSEWEDTPTDFGRIAAQNARMVINQRLQDAKREQVFRLYEGREGDMVTGIVQQIEGRVIILDLGDAEALMPFNERIPYERLDRGNRIKALVLEVRREGKGPQIIVSRSHPDLVKRLLELEVPELVDKTIEITGIAREAGHRTKISVISHDPNVDPKGACVGARGARVRQVVNELRGEKVDVVHWRNDPAQFVIEALGPAKVKEVHIDTEHKVAHVLVSSHQLSLAIGKEGQNARLAARLSGLKIDIRSDATRPESSTSPEEKPASPAPPPEKPPDTSAAEPATPGVVAEEAPSEEEASKDTPDQTPVADGVSVEPVLDTPAEDQTPVSPGAAGSAEEEPVADTPREEEVSDTSEAAGSFEESTSQTASEEAAESSVDAAHTVELPVEEKEEEPTAISADDPLTEEQTVNTEMDEGESADTTDQEAAGTPSVLAESETPPTNEPDPSPAEDSSEATSDQGTEDPPRTHTPDVGTSSTSDAEPSTSGEDSAEPAPSAVGEEAPAEPGADPSPNSVTADQS